MSYTDIESNLKEAWGLNNKSANESITDKHQNYIVCNCGNKLVFVDDTFNTSLQKYLDENEIYMLFNGIV